MFEICQVCADETRDKGHDLVNGRGESPHTTSGRVFSSSVITMISSHKCQMDANKPLCASGQVNLSGRTLDLTLLYQYSTTL